jgi:predicted RNA binding protein YcfA (HicA-like mRNA interferase family)
MIKKLGYVEVRRKGSHVRLTRTTAAAEHHITVPDHRTLAKGTLSDILSSVSTHTGIAQNDLALRLKG